MIVKKPYIAKRHALFMSMMIVFCSIILNIACQEDSFARYDTGSNYEYNMDVLNNSWVMSHCHIYGGDEFPDDNKWPITFIDPNDYAAGIKNSQGDESTDAMRGNILTNSKDWVLCPKYSDAYFCYIPAALSSSGYREWFIGKNSYCRNDGKIAGCISTSDYETYYENKQGYYNGSHCDVWTMSFGHANISWWPQPTQSYTSIDSSKKYVNDEVNEFSMDYDGTKNWFESNCSAMYHVEKNIGFGLISSMGGFYGDIYYCDDSIYALPYCLLYDYVVGGIMPANNFSVSCFATYQEARDAVDRAFNVAQGEELPGIENPCYRDKTFSLILCPGVDWISRIVDYLINLVTDSMEWRVL
jgi:hypothetical protein